MIQNLDDTQPRPAMTDNPIDLTPTLDPENPRRRGTGCGFQALIVGVLLIFALLIVGLAAAAGWTSGQRTANRNATATARAAIQEQLDYIPNDIAEGNLVLLDTRLRWLATITPGVSGLGELSSTATAMYENALPTATFTPQPTQAATDMPPTPTDVELVSEDGSFDLDALFSEAQMAVNASAWQDAIDLLDAIIALDPGYRATEVRQMMSRALNSYALQLYNSGQPAQANRVVDRAEEYGALAEGLSYERYAAELYLSARAAVGTGSGAAVNQLRELINLGANGRYYNEAVQLLVQTYIAQGDAYVAQGNPCAAVGSYQQATGITSSGSAYGKLSAARTSCELMSTQQFQSQFTPDPNQPVAPIGVPGT